MFIAVLALTVSGTLISPDPIIIKAPDEEITILPGTHLESEQCVIITGKTLFIPEGNYYFGSYVYLDGMDSFKLTGKIHQYNYLFLGFDGDKLKTFEEYDEHRIRTIYAFHNSMYICCPPPIEIEETTIESYEHYRKAFHIIHGIYDQLPETYISENAREVLHDTDPNRQAAFDLTARYTGL